MVAKYLATASVVAFLIMGTDPARADCTLGVPQVPSSRTAVSKAAGKIDISLDLRCVDQQYQGELVTPVGTYALKTGTYADGELRLQLFGGTDSVSLQARFEGEEFHGQFTSGDDSGPVDLRRTGEPRAPGSMEASLHLTPQQWDEDIAFFARELPVASR